MINITSLEKCIDLLLTRRSIRKFKKEPVDMKVILKILDIARWAPSARNRQPWEFIIITDKDALRSLGSLAPPTRPLLGAPAAIAIVVNPNLAPLTHLVDGACTTMYILLATHALGLGAVWINALRYQDEIRKILNIPKDRVPVAIVALGWPDESPAPRPRKELRDLVHVEKYGKKLKQ